MLIISNLPSWLWFFIGLTVGFALELYICSKRKDGVIHITQEDDRDTYLFEFNVPPENVPRMNQIVFKPMIERDGQS